MLVFIKELSPQLRLFTGFDDIPIKRYNIAPSTKVQILRGADDGIHIDPVK